MIISFVFLYIGSSLVFFIIVFLYANSTISMEENIEKNREVVHRDFKNRLKQDYFLSKKSDHILIRLKFLDSRFLRNSILVESFMSSNCSRKLKLSGRTDLKPFGFLVFLSLSFIAYIGVVYMYLVVKKARLREEKEMQVIADLSARI